MSTLELDESYFIQEIASLILLPETIDVICVSVSMAGWISIDGYQLDHLGRRNVHPSVGVSNAYWLAVTGNHPSPLPLDLEADGFAVHPEPEFQVRIYDRYIAYVCPFEDEVKMETITRGPSAFLLNPTMNSGGRYDRFIEDLNDEGDDSNLVNTLIAMVEQWDYNGAIVDDHYLDDGPFI